MWYIFLVLLRIIYVAHCCFNQTCVWGDWHPWGQCNSHCGAGQQKRWRSVCCKGELKLTYYQCIDRCNLTITEGIATTGCTNNSGCTTVTYVSGHSQGTASYLNGTSTTSGQGSAAAIARGVVGGLAGAAFLGLLVSLLFQICKRKFLCKKKEVNVATEKPKQTGA